MDYAIALPNVYQAISGVGTRAGLVAALVAALQSVGWTASAITGGSRMLGASPQGYRVYADIWDNGGSVSIQLRSAVSGAVGAEHRLGFSAAYSWNIAAHPAGFAISRPDTSWDPSGSAVLAGIPRLPDTCGLAAALTITEVWFSFGDWYGNPFAAQENPRANIDIGAGGNFTHASGCFNGALYPGGLISNWSQVQIVRQSSEAADNDSTHSSHPYWFDGTDLLYPAMAAWGDGADQPVKIRGQVYNAAVRSSPAVRDAASRWDDIDWVNYTDEYYWGSLWLMTSNGGNAIANVAY
jgi:hypothetical protein